MKPHALSSSPSLFLLATVSGIALLSACSQSGSSMFDSVVHKNRGTQTVASGRHTPALNPRAPGESEAKESAKAAPAKAEMTPYDRYENAAKEMAPKTEAAPKAEITPYDRYDYEGNEIEPQTEATEAPATQAPANNASGDSSVGGFFNRLFGNKPAPAANEKRKPIPSNPHYSSETVITAPAAPAPQASLVDEKPPEKLVDKMVEKSADVQAAKSESALPSASTLPPASKLSSAKPQLTPLSEYKNSPAPLTITTQKEEPKAEKEETLASISSSQEKPFESKMESSVAAEPDMAAEQPQPVSKPGWFSRLFHKISSDPTEEPVVAAAEEPAAEEASAEEASQDFSKTPDKELSAPDLASVPPTPKQFKIIKAERQNNMENLQTEHLNAEQEKQALNEEPTQLEAKPVDEEKPDMKEVVAVKPPVMEKAETVPAPTKKNDDSLPLAEKSADDKGGEVLLGHAAANGERAVSAAASSEAAAPASAPVNPEPKAQAPVEMTRAESVQPVQEVRHRKTWLERMGLFSGEEDEEDEDNDYLDDTDTPMPPPAPSSEAAPAPAPVAAEPAPAEKAVAEEETPMEQPPAPVVQMPQPVATPTAAAVTQAPTSAETPAPVASAPVLEQAPAPVVTAAPAPAPKPLLAPQTATAESMQTLTPAAAPPVAEATAASDQNAVNPDALPSPEILQSVRMLPPSRYSARQRATQHTQPSSY